MLLTDLIIKLGACQNAAEPKQVLVQTTNRDGVEVQLAIKGVLEFHQVNGKVFIRAELEGL